MFDVCMSQQVWVSMFAMFLHQKSLWKPCLVPFLLSVAPSLSWTGPSSWVVPKGVSFSSLDRLQFQPMEINEICDNSQLLWVSTRAIGVNFADIFCLLGLYSAANQVRCSDSFCPGLEYAGLIVDDPTITFAKGQRVLGFTRFGSYADNVHVPPHLLHPLSDSWSFSQGSAFLVQALTAWHGLVEIGRLPKGENKVVLIHSAAGGVGLWASEVAARRGATVILVVGSEAKRQAFEDRIFPLKPQSRVLIRGEVKSFAKSLAEVLCIVHGSAVNLPKQQVLPFVRDKGHGVDLVMESLGGQYFTDSFEAINRGGTLITFGSTSYVSIVQK
jgi:NADPH:quinone reductase-like Zn-dependent oxidoreductase